MSNLVLQPVREGRTHGSVFLLVSCSEPPDPPPPTPSGFIKKMYEVQRYRG